MSINYNYTECSAVMYVMNVSSLLLLLLLLFILHIALFGHFLGELPRDFDR